MNIKFYSIKKFLLKYRDIVFYSYLNLKYKMFGDKDKNSIDIVYLWVDGNDPAHKRKKNFYMNDKSDYDIEEKATKDYRWSNHDEIIISLKSVEQFCPWVSKIWIITDNQSPDLNSFTPAFKNKITIIDHEEIFREYKQYLPVFNSLSIESFLWRIIDLSEKFIYLNDDMFILRPVTKKDFYIYSRPVLRGKYKIKDESDLTLHHNVTLNGAEIIQSGKLIFFKQSHAPYALFRSQLELLFKTYKDHFENNIKFKFRSREQFNTVSLFNHDCLKNDNYTIKHMKDYIHISEAACNNYTREDLIRLLEKTNNKEYKFLCINDLGALKNKVPEFTNYIPIK